MSTLKYSVDIPNKNASTPGRIAYCMEHIGTEHIDWKIICNECPSANAVLPYTYYFKNEAFAIMFKLIYG